MSKRVKKPLRKTPHFTGDLAAPIVEDIVEATATIPDGSSAAEIEAVVNAALHRARRRQLVKLANLLSFYKIDPKGPERWLLLSLNLAADFVPGMRIYYLDYVNKPAKRGRPPKWQGERAAELVQAVEGIKAERQKGVTDAIRILQMRRPDVWGTPSRGGKKTTASLVARYYEALSQVGVQPSTEITDRELIRKEE